MAVFLAPSPRWSALKQTGFAAAGGKLYTYRVNTRIPKATFADIAGTIQNLNPITLDSAGEALIYWNDDELYYIELFDADGHLIYTQNGYPVVGAGGSNTVNIFNNRPNFVRNAQFNFWSNGDVINNPPGHADDFCDDWLFYRSNTNATIDLLKVGVIPSDTHWLENNTRNAFGYRCTNVGAGGETYKYIQQNYKEADSFGLGLLKPNQRIFFLFYLFRRNGK